MLFSTSGVDLKGIMVRDKSYGDKHCMISFMCAIKKKKRKTKHPSLQIQRLVVARDWGVGEMRERAQKDKNVTK